MDGDKLHRSGVDEVIALYEQDRYLDAYKLATRQGPLTALRGPEWRVIAGRIASRFSAHRLMGILHTLAYREHPHDPQVICFYAWVILARRGQARLWEYLHEHGDLPQANQDTRFSWLTIRATLWTLLRDFDSAERDLTLAGDLCPNDPWLWVCRSELSQTEDRYDEALDFARQALRIRPSYGAAIHRCASLLSLRNKLDEAIDLLNQAGDLTQNPTMLLHLSHVHQQREDHAAALLALDRFEVLTPLKSSDMVRWLAYQRAHLCYLGGDIDKSILLSRQARSRYHTQLANRMESNRQMGKRVVLHVPFVRQHYKTCAPATLAAISGYWSRSAEHLSIAEKICYDGTPAHYERQWACDNGFIAWEFTLTWDSTVALIDRGIPFTLTTPEATFSHLQAVVGYDSCRRTLVIRDPSNPIHGEFDEELALRRFRSSGPRAMLLVPTDRAELLEGLDLPDRLLWDQVHQVRGFLEKHRRAEAAGVIVEIQGRYPSRHYLVLMARLLLAYYDSDTNQILAIANEQLDEFANSPQALQNKLSCLRRLGRNEELADLLREVCRNPETDPVFRQYLAQELLRDARRHAETARLLRWVLRRNRSDAQAYYTYANYYWDAQEREKSIAFYRMAACMDNADEQLVRSLFIASRSRRQHEEILEFLENRFHRLGEKSSYPARTLFQCLEDVGRLHDGLKVLEKAMQLRPDDYDLKIFVAQVFMRCGRGETAQQLLEQSRDRISPMIWLRAAATFARFDNRPADALAFARQSLEIDPLVLDMHSEVAARLAQLQGSQIAINHLRTYTERFPHNYPLRQLLVEWQISNYAPSWEQDIRRLVEFHPEDAWAHRQLAENLRLQRKYPEAMEHIERARQLDPAGVGLFNILGEIHFGLGNLEAASQAWREGLKISADNDYAISRLMHIHPDSSSRRELLNYFQQQLESQVTFGDGLLNYVHHAHQVIAPEEVLAHLSNAHKNRPDLWQSWIALARHHLSMNQHDLSRQLALEATRRFPLIPEIWLDLARIYAAVEDKEAELSAVATAYQINPRASHIVRAYAKLLFNRGEKDQARQLLEQAIVRDPHDALIRGLLAKLQWDSGDREQGFASIQKATAIDPGYGWAWEFLQNCAIELKRTEVPLRLARQLVADRPGEAYSWHLLAQFLEKGDPKEAIESAQRAIELDAHFVDAYDLLAYLLAITGRYEEAVAACKPAAFGDRVPFNLTGRAAWVEYQRGNQAAALEQMEAVLKGEPHYLWGYHQMLSWLENTPDLARYLATAKKMTEADPESSIAWGNLASARLKEKRTDEAVADLQKALHLDPGYQYAARNLMDIYLSKSDIEQAKKIHQHMQQYQPGPAVGYYGVRLAFCQREPAAAAAWMESVCLDPVADANILDEIRMVYERNYQSSGYWRLMRKVLRDPRCNLVVHGCLVTYLCRKNGYFKAYYHMLRMRKNPAACDSALTALLFQVGEIRSYPWLWYLTTFHRKRIRANTHAWALAGFAWLNRSFNRTASKWLSSYHQKPNLEPWMLYNGVLAAGNCHRDDQAYDFALKALTLPPDAEMARFHARIALYAVLRNDLAVAKEHIIPAQNAKKPEAEFCYILANALIMMQEAAPEKRQEVLAKVRPVVLNKAASLPAAYWDRAIKHLYKRVGKRLDQLSGKRNIWGRYKITRPK